MKTVIESSVQPALPTLPAASAASAAPALLAKGALRRLALGRLEPTPENFAKAYAEEAGRGGAAAPAAHSPAPTVAWPALLERLVRNLERGGRQWTAARRKESLYRVLDSSRSDEARLAQRMQALLEAWERDRPLDGVEIVDPVPEGTAEVARAENGAAIAMAQPTALRAGGRAEQADEQADKQADKEADKQADKLADAKVDKQAAALGSALHDAVQAGLAETDERAAALARRLAVRVQALGVRAYRADHDDNADGADHSDVAAAVDACTEVSRWFGQRHELVRQLRALCGEMSQGLVDLSEDGSWARGQCEAMHLHLREPMDVRSLRAASAVLADTRIRQTAAMQERQAARAALKQLLAGMIGEVGALQLQAGGFASAIEQHAAAIEAADSLEGLTSVVQAMLAESRQMRAAVGSTHERLRRDGERATVLESRVRDLESELCRISEQASTDALTQVANRRGLSRLFDEESARAARGGEPLAIGLLDIDNFKKLNDRLGHAAGDSALKALAAAVQARLRPEDRVARYGGEEFVVLLRGLALEPAQEALTRLQRSLTASLFLHEGEEVFVTFSAGVTLWCEGETLESAIERADSGLYEAKRTGKNRTCTVQPGQL